MDLGVIAEDICNKEQTTMLVMYKDLCVASIDRKSGKSDIFRKDLMPYALWFEISDDVDARVQNIYNFETWCAGRLLTMRRTYYKEIVNACGFTQASTDKQRAEVAIQCRCLSLQDPYWVTYKGDTVGWKEVCLFDNSSDMAFIDVCLQGKNMSVFDLSPVISNITLDGTVDKAWQRNTDGFYLLKAGSLKQVENEISASNVLQKLGFNVVPYIYSTYNGEPITMCKAFTTSEIGFVTAEEYAYNHDIHKALSGYTRQFCELVLSEYIVGNSDLHARNWGFLFNDGEIVGMSPLFDFDHAFELNYNCNDIESKVWRAVGVRENLKEAARSACDVLGLDRRSFEGLRCEYVEKAVKSLFT